MYSEKIESLISAALADGVLTEKEKQVLFKRAQEEGIDLDEFEMVLDARLVELEKAEKEKAQKSAPKSTKLGEIRKCPQCGAVIGTFQMVCPECGYEFNNVETNKFVEKFTKGLEKAKNWQDFISAYPLPETIEDSLEFLNYMLPKTKPESEYGCRKAWRNKYFAVLDKLKFRNMNNKRVQELVATYREQVKISGWVNFAIWWKDSDLGTLLGLLLGLAACIGFMCLIYLI